MLISIADYAKKYGVLPDTVRQKCNRGGFKTAKKIANVWVIDDGEPYTDKRKKPQED